MLVRKRELSNNGIGVVALTGASGFIGSLLREALGAKAGEVRCLSRDPKKTMRDLPPYAVACRADLLDRDSLAAAFRGADVAYYLVHSLNESGSLLESESVAAENFGMAAAQAGIRRIVYLGALAQSGTQDSSPHIHSRQQVGEILRKSGVPVTEFRASVVIGNGSMPFEVIRALVERLPIMITPRWVRMKLQPISSKDVVDYLLAAIEENGDQNFIYEIGGRDVVSYEDLLREYAAARSLKRLMIGVPVITPRLSSHWLRLVTPAHFRMARRIVESTEHDSIVSDQSALEDFSIRPMTMKESLNRAVDEELDPGALLDRVQDDAAAFEEMTVGNSFLERRRVEVRADASCCFEVISRLGGEHGWYGGDWIWKLRGWMDRILGGPGLRTKQTPKGPPVEGAILDFWLVDRVIPGERLTLLGELKLPGEAWLDFRIRASETGAVIEQTVVYASRGALGLLYWYAVKGLHALVFEGMLREMASAAEKLRPAELSRASRASSRQER